MITSSSSAVSSALRSRIAWRDCVASSRAVTSWSEPSFLPRPRGERTASKMKHSAILLTFHGGGLWARFTLEPGSDDGQLSQDRHEGKGSYHVKHSSYVPVSFVLRQIKQCYQGGREDEKGDQTERARSDANLHIAPDE